MTQNLGSSGDEVARLTPEQRLVNALKAYAEETTTGTSVVVSDWAAVLYLEEVERDGTLSPRYVHLVSRKSSIHALRGLIQTLADYVFRLQRR